MFAKESKCEFFKTEVHYLGHIISHEGIMMDPSKVEAILNWPHPNNLEKLQIYLGLASFYRKFICDYAKIVVPMTNQLKAKGCNFFWGEEQQCSFDKLKVVSLGMNAQLGAASGLVCNHPLGHSMGIEWGRPHLV